MQTENVSSLERRLDLAVPLAQFEAEVAKRIQGMARKVKMAGFRPGKVPVRVVEQQHGQEVRQEVLSEAISQRFAQAIKELELNVAGYPRIEPKPAEEGGSDMVFSAVFEVYPEVVMDDITEVTLERPEVVVSDENVDKTIEILRKQRVIYTPVERAAAEGDQVNIDYHGTLDGVEFKGGQAKGYTLVVGEGHALKDFETAIVGMTAGESKTFGMTFPEDYHSKDLAGKLVNFDIKLNRVAEAVLPTLDADFAKSLGIEDGDLDKMRAEIRKNVEREVKRRIQAQLKETAMQVLVGAASFDLPRALIEMEIERLRRIAIEDMKSRGMKMPESSFPPSMYVDQAQQRVRLGLLLAAVVQANRLTPDPEHVRMLINEYAESYEQPEAIVAWYYASPERLSEVESIALEESVVNWVLGRARVIDKVVSFDELMGNV
ncbi:MAG: trigger factor [Sulfuricellaceae bacterium]